MVLLVLFLFSAFAVFAEGQIEATVGSFNNVGGMAFERTATVSESAMVGKQVRLLLVVELPLVRVDTQRVTQLHRPSPVPPPVSELQ